MSRTASQDLRDARGANFICTVTSYARRRGAPAIMLCAARGIYLHLYFPANIYIRPSAVTSYVALLKKARIYLQYIIFDYVIKCSCHNKIYAWFAAAHSNPNNVSAQSRVVYARRWKTVHTTRYTISSEQHDVYSTTKLRALWLRCVCVCDPWNEENEYIKSVQRRASRRKFQDVILYAFQVCGNIWMCVLLFIQFGACIRQE